MIGDLVGSRYEIQQELEPSPLFVSFKAMDRQSGRDVRLRVLEPSYSRELKFAAALREHVDRLRTVVHPALEKFVETVDEDGQLVLVSEFVQSIALDERVKRLASFSVQLAVSTGVSVCEALVAVHQAGLVHGDISGRNVLITPSGSVKLTMTGFWTAYPSSSKAGLAMLRGMAPYLAPEVTSGSMPDAASDVYSVGVLLFQMLAGRCPYLGESTVAIATKHSTAPYPGLRAINPSVPEALDELIRKCMAKSPNERYASMNDLLADLRSIQDALRFGRPLTWPIRRGVVEPTPVTPAMESDAPTKRKEVAAKKRRSQEYSDEFPKWLTALIVLFVAGSFAALGGWVWFNTHQPKLIDLPNIVAMNQLQAATTLQKLGLRMNVEKQQASEKFPAGVVMLQDPEAGPKQVRVGGIVQVVISAGGRFVAVPDLRGRSVDEAKSLLETLNLELSDEIDRVRDKDLDEGLIVSQSPERGRKIERSSKVKIKISNGDKRVADESSSQRYTYTLNITMPSGAAPIVVRIDITDDRETQTVHEEEHEPGDKFTVEADGYGKEVTFRIFYDNELVKQIIQKASDASPTGGQNEQ